VTREEGHGKAFLSSGRCSTGGVPELSRSAQVGMRCASVQVLGRAVINSHTPQH
jgi:hypothetical protein